MTKPVETTTAEPPENAALRTGRPKPRRVAGGLKDGRKKREDEPQEEILKES